MTKAFLLGVALLPALPGAVIAAATTAPSEPASPEAAAAPADSQRAAFFEARVRPLLVKHCNACHSEKVSQGGLKLDSAAPLLKGGDGGPAVVPGKPEESRLIQAIQHSGPVKMPPAGKLAAAEIETLVQWVRDGAYFPDAAGKGGSKKGPLGIAEGRKFWSIRPLAVSNPPKVRQAGWVRRRIDGYLLAKLEAAGLTPSPEADRRVLIRRLSFDLTGLPPTPDEVEQFVGDKSPDAYERLVERLLASPHYGERWARHWLDLARYCDIPESWAQTEAQPWLYRDWVVKALNNGMPYDRFVSLQLAADEMPDAPPSDRAALGFLGLSPSYWKELKLAPDVIKTVVAEEWEERINTVSGTVLGLTVACARCHVHKFDPITANDYYALAGDFASTRLSSLPLLPTEEARRVAEARSRFTEMAAQAKALKEKAAADKAKAPELMQQAESIQAQAAALRKTPHFDAPLSYSVDVAALQVLPDGADRTRLEWTANKGQNVQMQPRGNAAKPGDIVPRRFLEVLSNGAPAPLEQGSGRRNLAEAMFRDSKALAARVAVNRVWKHHFGRGLVETPSNFGVQGDRPTHPELLDDLAARFIASGWSLKWLHREIVLSAAYRQSSRPTAAAMAKDPDNRMLGRMSRRRLEVEAWRDAILSVSGALDPKLGGAPKELSDATNNRRTLYGLVRRRDLDDLLRLYDFPDPTGHSPARFHTTTPLQQLFVLNSPFIGKQAQLLGERIAKAAPSDVSGRIDLAYRLLYGRLPAEREKAAAARFLGAGEATPAHWAQYLEVLLAGNELMYVD